LVTVAKLGTVADVGHFAYALAVTAPIFIFSQLQLRGLQATDAAADYSFGEYLSLRLVTTVAAFLCTCAVVTISGVGGSVPVVIAMALAKSIECLADLVHGRLQQTEHLHVIGASFASRGVLGWTCFTAGFLFTGQLVLAIAAMTASWAVSCAFIECRAVTADALSVLAMPPARRLASLAWFAAPMGFVMALGSLNVQLPRYFIENAIGVQGLGIFAALATIPLAGTMVVNSLCQAASSRMAQAIHARDLSAFRRIVYHLLCIAAFAGLGIMSLAVLTGDRLLEIVYSPQYIGYQATFITLSAWGGASYCVAVLGSAVTAARQLRVQLPITAFATLATGIGAMILVPSLGLTGAAIAVTAGAIVHAIALATVLQLVMRRCA
jgi:O-antigen/teichoic acid export membrane protein